MDNNGNQPLTDELLEKVAGGVGSADGSCPKCNATKESFMQVCCDPRGRFTIYQCQNCGHMCRVDT